jgi:pimeloyl-ACP methyl ester carboxylesterase
MVAAHWSRPGNFAGMRSHVMAVPDTVREMQNAEPILKIPVLVLTPGKSTPLTDDYLARIGCRVRQVIAHKSAHWIHLDQPDLVVDSIREMVTATAAETMIAAD